VGKKTAAPRALDIAMRTSGGFTDRVGDSQRVREQKALARRQLHESVARDEDRQERRELERAIGEGYADGARGPFRGAVMAAFRGTESAGGSGGDAPTRPAAAGQGPRRVAASMQCVSVGVCEGVGAGECAGLEGSEGEWSMADDEGLFAAVAGP